jgi:hypothetical protein
MRIASSTLQNCGISFFIFDDIASLAGSADATPCHRHQATPCHRG